jgi:hypothetical protein
MVSGENHRMKQVKTAVKPRGSSPERMRIISKKSQWKKGQSGNPAGRFPDKAVSEGLKAFYYTNPAEFKRFLSAAHKKSSGKNPSAKFWELIADRIEGKVTQQVALTGTVTHVLTEQEKKTAASTIELIRTFESNSSEAIAGELVEEIPNKTDKK